MDNIKIKSNDIVCDAYYLIKLFNDAKLDVTQLHIQKLMYLFEAYYLNINENMESLYECDYQAWNFGPVAIPLYKKFKKYGKTNIKLTKEQEMLIDTIDDDKKNRIKEIFDVFKGFTAMELVNFTHMDGSPWKNAWSKNEYSNIDKKEMKEWFSRYVEKVET